MAPSATGLSALLLPGRLTYRRTSPPTAETKRHPIIANFNKIIPRHSDVTAGTDEASNAFKPSAGTGAPSGGAPRRCQDSICCFYADAADADDDADAPAVAAAAAVAVAAAVAAAAAVDAGKRRRRRCTSGAVMRWISVV